MTLSGAFLDYDLSGLKEPHPIRFHALKLYIMPALPWALTLTTLVYGYLIYIEERSRPRIEQLQANVEQLELKHAFINERVRDLFDGYLYNLAASLEFGKSEVNCERITLYIYDADTKMFVPCGRFSGNPRYRAVHRTEYPADQGCIAKGWENSWHFDNSFPSITQRKKYAQKHAEYGVPEDTCDSMNMKSRLYASCCIQSNGDPLAVLVVESVDATRFTEDELKQVLQEQNSFLANTIKVLANYIPRPSQAASRGL